MKGLSNGGDSVTESEFISAVNRNKQRLFLIAFSFTKCRDDAEDMLQNTFMKMWKHNKSFKDDMHIDKWLTTVCVNECRNCVKKRKLCDVDEIQIYEHSFDNTESYDIFNAVMKLPEKERVVIHLFYYEDLSVIDISKLLKESKSAIKTRLYRARKELKENLGDEWINE